MKPAPKKPKRPDQTWPSDRTARLRELMKIGGKSYSQMGRELGITRNAIAGKVQRIRQEEEAARDRIQTFG